MAEKFTSSLGIDRRLGLFDVRGSMAHVRMLGRQKIIPAREARILLTGLRKIKTELEKGSFQFQEHDEDIHSAIERRLVELTGKIGEKLHTARSRNDQVVLDEKLFLKEAVPEMLRQIRKLQLVLVQTAEANRCVIMPAYTHLQPAQPVLLAHHLLAYVEMLERDCGRLNDGLARSDELPLGVAACAGTTLPIDRHKVAAELGFKRISRNSLDTVSDRDFIVEIVFGCALTMIHLSRLAEDLILWSTQEFRFIDLPEQFCTGSSIMPQKKNPDVLELIRGRAAVAAAAVTGLLSLMKGLPLAYNRDLQEDKHFLFEVIDLTVSSVEVMAALLPGVVFHRERMARAAQEGFSLATDIAEYLVEKGVPFREAHRICAGIVRHCLQTGADLKTLSLSSYRSFSPVFEADLLPRLSLRSSVCRRRAIGGTSPVWVTRQLNQWKKTLKSSATVP
ncbi:MAG TPA: argininosuccinate lyase [bacterium]|nr:argininosuccinate lyase [bacterium]